MVNKSNKLKRSESKRSLLKYSILVLTTEYATTLNEINTKGT